VAVPGDDLAVERKPDGRAPRLANPASRRLEDRNPRHRQPGVRGCLYHQIDSRVLRKVETRRR
jgi:hypothetical protein